MVRRPPRKHKVREHGRGKPTGGRTGVDAYDRGRDRSTTSSSAGERAQTRATFLRAKDRRKAQVMKFTEFDEERNEKVAFYRRKHDAERSAKQTGVEVIPIKKTYEGETRTWYSVWGGEIMGSKVVPATRARKKKLSGRAFVAAARRSARQTVDQILGEEE